MKTIAQYIAGGITTLADLRDALQTAMQLEFATIPPYLCAEWSINSDNDPGGVGDMIQDIVREEMLHFALAGNMLSAIGGMPSIANAGFVPSYPTKVLPGGIQQKLPVDLQPLSANQLQVFMQIEFPEFPPVALLAGATAPTTIGAFYDTIAAGFAAVNPTILANANFVNMDEAVQIKTIADAQVAILRIKGEGEGTEGSPGQPPADGTKFAHYYVFKEMLTGKSLVQTNGQWAFTGPAIPFPAVFNFTQSNTQPDPSLAFNQALSHLLIDLQTCWTSGTRPSISAMFGLKSLGQGLIQQGIRPEFLWSPRSSQPTAAAGGRPGTAPKAKPPRKPTKPRQIPATHLIPALSIPRDFTINEVPFKPNEATREVEKTPALGPLAAFKNTFTGRGFNTIFRPQNSSTPTDLPIPQPGSDNILELNLTIESLSFSDPLGSVPNRGREQRDIFLNGVPYLQSISDVTDPTQTTPIHFEPGLWVIVEATTDPAQPEQMLARMASIPHGTTINAQGTFFTVAGGPQIHTVDITPFPIDHPENRIDFPSQTVTNTGTARIPQDLSVAPTITQRLLKDPNTLLSDHIAGLTILSTDVIQIDTKSTAEPGGGTDNIGFLVGDTAGPNADAVEISATFWIETVQAEIEVGPSNAGESQTVSPAVPAGAPAPKFAVTSASAITEKQSITVIYPQIQYTQNVSLNFATLTWPHVSVATLVPSDPIAVETYVVQPGDTLSGIAERFGVSLGALEAANPQITTPDLIFPGQVVVIRISADVVTYVVRPGDTLSGIAERFGVSLGALEAANPQITNPDLINPGQVIKIP